MPPFILWTHSMNAIKRSMLCFVFLLSACSGPGYFEPIQPLYGNDSVLYIYRPKADNIGMQPLRLSYPDLILNGDSIGVLNLNHYRSVRLEAGEHTLKATGLTKKARWKPKDKDLTFKIEPGEIKYIKLNVRYDMSKMNLGQPGAKHLIHLTPMAADTAIYEIRETSEEE